MSNPGGVMHFAEPLFTPDVMAGEGVR